MNAFSSENLTAIFKTNVVKMLGYQSSADWAVPVFVRLCLSLLRCACLCYAVPVPIGLCLSLFGCACPYWAVPVFVTLCLSVLGCACLCYAVPIFIGLCLSLFGCACLCWAVPVFFMMCLIEFSCAGPCVCLCCLETEYWPWFPFIHLFSRAFLSRHARWNKRKRGYPWSKKF